MPKVYHDAQSANTSCVPVSTPLSYVSPNWLRARLGMPKIYHDAHFRAKCKY